MQAPDGILSGVCSFRANVTAPQPRVTKNVTSDMGPDLRKRPRVTETTKLRDPNRSSPPQGEPANDEPASCSHSDATIRSVTP